MYINMRQSIATFQTQIAVGYHVDFGLLHAIW